MKINNFLLVCLVSMTLMACNDVIDFETPASGNSQIVIDAWITDEPGKEQSVKLMITQPYFDKATPPPALGATVFVANEDSVVYQFRDIKNDGNYIWTPRNKEDKILQVGKQYGLYVAYAGEEYISISKANRVPKIDSIVFTEESNPFAADTSLRKGFIGEFYGKDFAGNNDTYWIRSYRNDTLRNKPAQIQLAWDAAGSPANSFDGGTFILPIRRSVTEFGRLFKDKEKVKVDLYSITNEAFYFLSLVRQASQDGGLFSVPQSNIPSNIQNRKEKGKTPLGFFGVSMVSSFETFVDKTKAKKKQ